MLFSALRNISIKSFQRTQPKASLSCVTGPGTPRQPGIEFLHVHLSPTESGVTSLRSLWAHPRIQSVSLCFISRLSATAKTDMLHGSAIGSNAIQWCIIDLRARAKTTSSSEFHPASTRDESQSFEDQRQASTSGSSIRGLLGRALHVVRNNPDFSISVGECPSVCSLDEDGPIIPLGKRKAQPDAVRARDYCICFPRAFRELRSCRLSRAYVLSFERYLQYIEASRSFNIYIYTLSRYRQSA
jgi:hypothetical protein